MGSGLAGAGTVKGESGGEVGVGVGGPGDGGLGGAFPKEGSGLAIYAEGTVVGVMTNNSAFSIGVGIPVDAMVGLNGAFKAARTPVGGGTGANEAEACAWNFVIVTPATDKNLFAIGAPGPGCLLYTSPSPRDIP
jgi:hypothetical protein